MPALKAIDRARGQEIERLDGIARMDAIAAEMWGPPQPRGPGTPLGGAALTFGHVASMTNHNARLAELLEVTSRQIRRIRAAQKIDRRLLARLTTEWRLWRRRQSEIKETAKRMARKAELENRIRALRGDDA